MLFIEAPRSEEELQLIARTFRDIPLLVNMVEGGKTPQFSFDYLKEMGFKVVLYPTSAVRVAMKALQDYAAHLFNRGDTKNYLDHVVTFEGRNLITGLNELQELEKKHLPGSV